MQPDTLAGSIVCVLVQNPLAFQAEHRVPVGLYLKSPLDQMPIDPWTSFPGHTEGNITERLAATLFSLITTCDYAIDVHTPTRGGRYVPITILPHPALGASFQRCVSWDELLAPAISCRPGGCMSTMAFCALKQRVPGAGLHL